MGEMSIKKQRLFVLREIDSLTEAHCKPCSDKECIKCPIGIQLRELGSKLGKVKVPAIEKKALKPIGGKKVEFTKEAYQAVKNEGKTDKQITAIFGIDHNKLYKVKKEWGLITQNKPSWSKSEEEYKTLIVQLKDELGGRDDLIGKLEATIKKYEQSPSTDEDIKTLNNELDQRNEMLQEVKGILNDLSYRLDTSENEREKAIEEITELQIENDATKRELIIAEENLTAANKSLRGREAQVEQLERELTYARENERTFKTALKAAL